MGGIGSEKIMSIRLETPASQQLGAPVVDRKISYIPSSELESANEIDFSEVASPDLYVEADEVSLGGDSETFLLTVDQSRILTAEGEQFLFKRLNFLRFKANALQATLDSKKPSKKVLAEIERLLSEAEKTREQLTLANLRLVTSIVRRYCYSPEQFDDYLAEGQAILVNAIDKFDYSRGFRFSTYVTHAVQRRIFLLNQQNRRRSQLISSEYSEQLGNVVSQPYVSEKEHLQIADAVDRLVASFDTVLDNREQYIVRARFGLDGSKAKSLRQIGDEIGLSKERVRQLFNSCIQKLAGVAGPVDKFFDR
jgi:RNA polymerase primary sigma factor